MISTASYFIAIISHRPSSHPHQLPQVGQKAKQHLRLPPLSLSSLETTFISLFHIIQIVMKTIYSVFFSVTRFITLVTVILSLSYRYILYWYSQRTKCDQIHTRLVPLHYSPVVPSAKIVYPTSAYDSWCSMRWCLSWHSSNSGCVYPHTPDWIYRCLNH